MIEARGAVCSVRACRAPATSQQSTDHAKFLLRYSPLISTPFSLAVFSVFLLFFLYRLTPFSRLSCTLSSSLFALFFSFLSRYRRSVAPCASIPTFAKHDVVRFDTGKSVSVLEVPREFRNRLLLTELYRRFEQINPPLHRVQTLYEAREIAGKENGPTATEFSR